jgi:hypothetical protein
MSVRHHAAWLVLVSFGTQGMRANRDWKNAIGKTSDIYRLPEKYCRMAKENTAKENPDS